MLNTNIEFRKGILFVRLDGVLDKFTMSELDDTYKLIIENKIMNIVFNIDDVYKIDSLGMNKLFNIYKRINKNKYHCYFIKNSLLNNIKNIIKFDNELKAMEVIWN